MRASNAGRKLPGGMELAARQIGVMLQRFPALRSFFERRPGRLLAQATGDECEVDRTAQAQSIAGSRWVDSALADRIEQSAKESFGGLSRAEVLVLLNHCKAGAEDPGVYRLVVEWKREQKSWQKPNSQAPAEMGSPVLLALTVDFMKRVLDDSRPDLLHQLADLLEAVDERGYVDEGVWNHDAVDWWQYCLLCYLLDHPKPRYTMRELWGYLQEEVGPGAPSRPTIRQFCRHHGIALDASPGAPKQQRAA